MLSSDIQKKLLTKYNSFDKSANRFAKVPLIILNATSLSSTEVKVYSNYVHMLDMGMCKGTEISIDTQKFQKLVNLCRQQLLKINKNLHRLGLIKDLDKKGRLLVTPPDDITIGHICALQPPASLLPKSIKEEIKSISLGMSREEREQILDWLKISDDVDDDSSESEWNKKAPLVEQKSSISGAEMFHQIDPTSVLNPTYSMPLHRYQQKDRIRKEYHEAPDGAPSVLQRVSPEPVSITIEEGFTVKEPLRDIDDESPPVSKNEKQQPTARQLISEATAKANERKANVKRPIHDIDQEKAPDSVDIDKSILDGPDRAPWPQIKWNRFIATLSIKYKVPLWFEGRKESAVTLSDFYTTANKSIPVTKLIKPFVEMVLVDLCQADEKNPHGDLVCLKLAAKIIENIFASWQEISVSFYNKPTDFPFNPKYLTTAKSTLKKWYLTSQVATDGISANDFVRMQLQQYTENEKARVSAQREVEQNRGMAILNKQRTSHDRRSDSITDTDDLSGFGDF